ncbi:MAG: helix-turn-helix domain-containing protein [Terriglobia bacterium]
MNWVFENSEAQYTARLVLIAIANDADSEGQNAWPSIERIARHAHVTTRRVKDVLPELERLGELVIERGKGPCGTHLYTLPKVSAGRRRRGENFSPPTSPKLPSQGGENLSPQGVKNSPDGGEKSGEKGVKTFHPTQEQTQKRDPELLPPTPLVAVASELENILPDWIPRTAWRRFAEMRQRIGKPLNDTTRVLAVQELARLLDRGQNPELVLNQSTLNSWAGLFEVRNGTGYSPSADRQRRSLDAIAAGVRRLTR